MSKATVVTLIGPGAGVGWPEVRMQQFAQNVWLQVQAGSSGPPNRQLDLEVAQKLVPLLLQLPGISPELIARFVARAIDPRLSIADFYNKSLPSVQAQNANAGADKHAAPPPKASINYKDAPPSIQRQMEQAEGYQPAKEMDGTVHMDHLKGEKEKSEIRNPKSDGPAANGSAQ